MYILGLFGMVRMVDVGQRTSGPTKLNVQWNEVLLPQDMSSEYTGVIGAIASMVDQMDLTVSTRASNEAIL